jgi:hypothetical protein
MTRDLQSIPNCQFPMTNRYPSLAICPSPLGIGHFLVDWELGIRNWEFLS